MRLSQQQSCSDSEFMTRLTPRQWEVLALVITGRRNREIASELVITQYTVVNHLNAAFQAMEVSSRTQATILLLSKGIDAPKIADYLRGRKRR